ncbi:uncharacterized protein LOC135392773 [Ornithodoros turicata]|uniref:uncharacterized protein LOC135392773 n=1 Tax=Ornithodoros turicata TaxID=34597 RepID=UPI0031396DEF
MGSLQQKKVDEEATNKCDTRFINPALVVFLSVEAAYVMQWPYDCIVYTNQSFNRRQIALIIAMQQVASVVAFMFPWPWCSRRCVIIVCQISAAFSCVLKMNHMFQTAAVIQGVAVGTTMAVTDLKQSVQRASHYMNHVSMLSWTLSSFLVEFLTVPIDTVYVVAGYIFLCTALGSHFFLGDNDVFVGQPEALSEQIETWMRCLLWHLESKKFSILFLGRTCIEATAAVALMVFPIVARDMCFHFSGSMGILMVLRLVFQIAGCSFGRFLSVSWYWRLMAEVGGCITSIIGITALNNFHIPIQVCWAHLLLAFGSGQSGAGRLATWPGVAGNLLGAGLLVFPTSEDGHYFQEVIRRASMLICLGTSAMVCALIMWSSCWSRWRCPFGFGCK